ncbi:putative porin, partial [Klebsiella pneumoniae]
ATDREHLLAKQPVRFAVLGTTVAEQDRHVDIAALAGQAQAQPPAPSENATINLIRLLVQQGVLKKEQADALVRQAEAEALQAQQARQAVAPAAAVAAVPGEVRV